MARIPPKKWQEMRSAYRRGEGSLRDIAKKFGVDRSTLERRSTREGWEEERRQAAGKAQAKAAERDVEQLADMLVRHRRVANKALERLEKLLEADGKKAPGAFALQALVQALNGAARAERLAAGVDPEKPVTPAAQAGAAGTTLVVKRQRTPGVPPPQDEAA